MSDLAVLFPGQGAQFVGMGRDAYERSPAARAVFERADEVLGFALSEITFSGPEERLAETDVLQPAIVTTSIAIAEAAREAGWNDRPAAAAGLSLGEYSALVFAGALSLSDAVTLVHKRGTFMREAGLKNPGGMLSVMGLADEEVAAIVEEASSEGLICAANLNCPGQVVLSGRRPALEKAAELAELRGAMKTVFVKVDGAFHSPLMQEAADRLAAELAKTDIKAPEVAVMANQTADFAREPEEIRRLLVKQVTSPVLWQKSMERLLEQGISRFIEIGPGRVLTGLMKRIDRKTTREAVGDIEAAEKLAGAA